LVKSFFEYHILQLKLEKYIDKNIPLDLEEGIDRVARGDKLTVLTTDSIGYYLQHTKHWDIDYDRPRFHLSTTCYVTSNVGWVTPRHAYYSSILRKEINRMVEAGLTKKLEMTFLHQKREAYVMKAQPRRKVLGWNRWMFEERALTLDHLGYANKLLTFGWLVAMIVFILEMTYVKLRRSCKDGGVPDDDYESSMKSGELLEEPGPKTWP
jgi:hypothetical protein